MTRLTSGGKINLGMRIRGRRHDGYHIVHSILYPLPWPRDELWVEATRDDRLRIHCPQIPTGPNILETAWRLFADAVGQRPGATVRLHKRVPMGAGLGGGSANAAIFLQWLNATCGYPLDAVDLHRVGTKVGADVPFFLQAGPVIANGIGDELTPVAFDGEGQWLVLVYPGFASATAAAYAAWDAARGESCHTPPGSMAQEGLTKDVVAARSQSACSDHPSARHSLRCTELDVHNDLEQTVFARLPLLGRIKAQMLGVGASGAAMSGSGSSVFGIFPSPGSCADAVAELRRQYSLVYCMPMINFGM